jgi:hypothetical protein
MMKVAYIAAGLVLAMGSADWAAQAQEPGAASQGQAQYQGTPAQRAACRPDVYRLCAGEIPNVRAITACLRKNSSRLSEGCAAVFAVSQ